jgi:hypothetical protein
MRAVDIACEVTVTDLVTEKEGTLGSVMEELTDAEEVPATVARAAISKIEQRLAAIRDESRGKMLEATVKAPKDPKTPSGFSDKPKLPPRKV